jgi:hypothetical protein
MFKIGDVVAFSSNDPFSLLIRLFTWSKISHVGIMVDDEFMLESMYPKVRIKRVMDRVLDPHFKYSRGKCYIFELNEEAREKLEAKEELFDTLVDTFIDRRYDLKLVALMGIDKVFKVFGWGEDKNEFICSELVGAIYEKLGIIKDINVSKLTPRKVVELPIYKGSYQLK